MTSMNRSLVTVILITMLLFSNTYVNLVQSQSEYRVLLVVIPGLPLSYLNETYSLLYDKWNETFIVKVDSEPPYTLLYHELLLLNTTWDLSKKLVLIDKVVIGDSIVEPYRAIDYNLLNNTWGFLTTVFINVRSVDPKIHNRTLNPYYNYTFRFFPPQLLTLKINETIKWNLLNTTINVTYVNNTYFLNIEGYARNIVFKNTTLDTDPILINITVTNLTVHKGVYNIKFRIIRFNETHVVIFTPGSLGMYDWLSPYYGIYTKPVIPSLPIEYFQNLDVDDIEWVFNETTSFYIDMVSYAIRHRDASLYVLSIPLYEEIYQAVTRKYLSRDIAVNLTRYLVSFINRVWDTVVKRLGSTYLAIYVPYVYINETLDSIVIPSSEYIAPGLYRVVNVTDTLLKLIEQNVDFKLFKHGNEHYVLVKYGNYSFNNIVQISNGYFILYPSSNTGRGVVVNTRNLIGFLTTFVRGYGLGLIDVNQVIGNLTSEIRSLRDQVVNLNRTVTRLNSTLINTELELGRCRSDYLNLSGLVSDLRSEIDRVKFRETQWMIYALAGTASILAIITVMYLIGLRGLRKK